MTEDTLVRSETTVNGTRVRLIYDEEADILEIFFADNEPATGIELTDHILLRMNRTTQEAISLTLLDFSILAERTLYGPRSFPLSSLESLPPDLREAALAVVNSSPVNHFLALTNFQTADAGHVPAVHVYPASIKRAA